MISSKNEQKLISLFYSIKNNNYFKNIIITKYLKIGEVFDYYDSLPIIRKNDILDNISDYVSSNIVDAVGKDLKKILYDVNTLTHNHDKQLFIE